MKIQIILLFLLFPWLLQAQTWKKYRYELEGGLGTTNFMGDLGGGNQLVPTHFMGLRDLDLTATRPVFHGGFRFKMTEIMALKLNLDYGLISGDDALTNDYGRNQRNMSFRSHVFEVSTQYEFYILKDKGKRFVSQQPRLINNISIYLFGGLGFCHFNPKAKYQGKWVALQPLGTEGQELPSDPSDPNSSPNKKRYNLYALTIPVGIGIKYNLNRRYAIELEIGNHYTTSDYIDDTSGEYYDIPTLRKYRGDMAADLAYRSKVPWQPGTKIKGGNRYNDAYVFTTVNFIYKLTTTGKGLPKF